MKIGIFNKTEKGAFEGTVSTLTFAADLVFEPAIEKAKDRSPDFRIINTATGFDIGAGWNEKSERTGKPYISVKLDDPAFAYPLWGALTAGDNGEYQLNWSRPKPKADPDTSGEETL